MLSAFLARLSSLAAFDASASESLVSQDFPFPREFFVSPKVCFLSSVPSVVSIFSAPLSSFEVFDVSESLVSPHFPFSSESFVSF